VRPLHDWMAIVPEVQGEVVVGGILMTRAYSFRSMKGKVVAKGSAAPADLALGDTVWYEMYSGHPHQSAPIPGDLIGLDPDQAVVLMRKDGTPSSAPLDAECQLMLKNRGEWTERDRVQYQRKEDALADLARNQRVLPGSTSQAKAGVFAVEREEGTVPLSGWLICEEQAPKSTSGSLALPGTDPDSPTYRVLSVAPGAPVTPESVVLVYPNSGVVMGHATMSKLVAIREEELLAVLEEA